MSSNLQDLLLDPFRGQRSEINLGMGGRALELRAAHVEHVRMGLCDGVQTIAAECRHG